MTSNPPPAHPEDFELIVWRLEQAFLTRNDAEVLVRGGGQGFSVMNRYYYAAYYAALALLQSRRLAAHSHKGMISLIHRDFIREGLLPVECGEALGRLFTFRQEEDYHRKRNDPPPDLAQALDDLETVLQAVVSYLRQVDPQLVAYPWVKPKS